MVDSSNPALTPKEFPEIVYLMWQSFLSSWPASVAAILLLVAVQTTLWWISRVPAFLNKTQRLGLPIGQHISFMAKDGDGKDVYRSYTPISDNSLLGRVDFLIKLYPQGKMSQVIAALQEGQTMMMKGPKGQLSYKPNMKKKIGMLAGGSGITPMYQVMNAILKNPKDTTEVSLVFGNVTEEDILLRMELDSLAEKHPNRLKVHYILDKPPESWTGGSGYITQAVVEQHLPPPSPQTLILRCGPTPMMEAMKKVLTSSGYSEDQQFQF
ncbi:hypothetical protein CEUSTIGMA_g8116.t1 [Chlamydomonas eustigma]|uniref:NADH-cytochrome b5 reductase n=1 Tax=Chlamydomonas eustigma TaxID=1157962 RepID=A0A250XC82_9CHLO|nr:hypothetical protein CEUSTIGMA_g8116.t1 [Chlamydomonas eustigma]|eukprot:GAX80681.1 hypothetical protein CEUSTIGMA_g8116.t1 [Chlamydomonas eustigma]